MKDNRVRQLVKGGKPAIGCFLGLGSPAVAELMGLGGMDWLVIETEHNGLDSAEVQHMLMAIGNTDAVPIVRVPNRDQVYIQRALDMGAMGILVPGVRTAEEARAIVSYTRFPPVGVRSWGAAQGVGIHARQRRLPGTRQREHSGLSHPGDEGRRRKPRRDMRRPRYRRSYHRPVGPLARTRSRSTTATTS